MRLSILTVAVLWCAAGLAGQPSSAKCGLKGAVLNHASGEPLRRVNIQFLSTQNAGARPYSTVSTAEGSFEFVGIEPGEYTLRAERQGFELHQSAIILEPGQQRGDVQVKLLPHDVVAGKVMDEFGDPLSGVPVQAMMRVYMNGDRRVIPVSQGVTNDLGEYRIHPLPSGRYFIQAASSSRIDGGGDMVLLPAYYPNTDRPDSAQPLQLAPGQVHSGTDFLLRRAPAFSIRGRIATTVRSPTSVMLYLAQRNARSWLTAHRQIQVVNGVFELTGVTAGSYSLIAEQFAESGVPVAGALIPLEIADRDIDGVSLVPTPRPDIIGKLIWEQSPPQLGGGRNPRVVLRPETGGASLPASAPIGADVEENGSFRIRSSPPGVYHLQATNLPPGFYLKSVRLGDSGNASMRLDLSRSQAEHLTVVVSSRSGALEGNVESNRAGLQVFALAEGNPWWSKTVVTGERGHFEVKGLAPGEYRVLAFERIDPEAYQDAELMKSLESYSQRVTVRENGKERLTLKPVQSDAGRMSAQ